MGIIHQRIPAFNEELTVRGRAGFCCSLTGCSSPQYTLRGQNRMNTSVHDLIITAALASLKKEMRA